MAMQPNDVATAGAAQLTRRGAVVRTLAPESLVKERGTAVPFK